MAFRKLTRSALDLPVLGILTGRLGVGKSTLAVAGWPDYRAMVTRGTSFARIEQWISAHPAEARDAGIMLPRSIVELVDEGPTGDWYGAWEAFLQSVADGKLLQPGCVIDEGSTLLAWIVRDAVRIHGRGWDTNDLVQEIIRQTIRSFRFARKGLIWVSHWTDATYHVRDPKRGEPAASSDPRQGAQKYPAGPKFPYGTLIRDVCKEFDFVWEVTDGDGDDLDDDDSATEYAPVRIRTKGSKSAVRKTAREGVPPMFSVTDVVDFRQRVEGFGLLTHKQTASTQDARSVARRKEK